MINQDTLKRLIKRIPRLSEFACGIIFIASGLTLSFEYHGADAYIAMISGHWMVGWPSVVLSSLALVWVFISLFNLAEGDGKGDCL